MLELMYEARATRERNDDIAKCETSLSHFVQRAWPHLKPEDKYIHNWHIDAVAEKLEAISRQEIYRLLVWLPPGAMKSMLVSVLWPAWEWTTNPWVRYWGASYETRFAARLSAMSRDLMMGEWYQSCWGERFKFGRVAENYFDNDRGGTRLATSPESVGTGEHGHRILIDDPIKASVAEAASKVMLQEVNNWYDGTVVSRGVQIGFKPARVIVMQRLHEEDLSAHVYELEGDWEVLCLPERYESKHQFVSPLDVRTVEGQVLWPEQRDDEESDALARSLGPHRAAGQLQQRPTAKEGGMLKTADWRFYDPRIQAADTWDTKKEFNWTNLPAFSMVVQTVDCPLKDKETNDNIAIQVWGIHGAQRYLLDLQLGKMNYSAAKRAVREMAQWARRNWPRARHVMLVENGGYGSDIELDLKMEFTGIKKINPQNDGDKEVRADRASESLESHHCFIPGYGPPGKPSYDAVTTPQKFSGFISNCSKFPYAPHDDDVDAWSQMINWMRGNQTRAIRMSSASSRRRAAAVR
jgi:predicted phage terminase large subunit-like protein